MSVSALLRHRLHRQIAIIISLMFSFSCTPAPFVASPAKPTRVVRMLNGSLERIRMDQSKLTTIGISPATNAATAINTWKNELEAACDTWRLFNGDRSIPIEIVVVIEKFEPSAMAFDHFVTATYQVKDRRNDLLIKEIRIETVGHDSSFVGSNRSTISMSKSVVLNIEKFISTVSE